MWLTSVNWEQDVESYDDDDKIKMNKQIIIKEKGLDQDCIRILVLPIRYDNILHQVKDNNLSDRYYIDNPNNQCNFE